MRVFVLIGLLLALATPLRAEPNFPAFTSPVVDAANLLDEAGRQALDAKLLELQRTTKIQFAVATVPSLEGEEIEPYANALFRRWGIGQKGADNGLLLLIAPKERKIRFEVGYGLEGTMTDIQSKLIIANDIAPKMKSGDPGGAIEVGVDHVIKVLSGPTQGASQSDTSTSQVSQPDDGGGFIILVAIVVIVVLFLVIRRRNRQVGPWWGGWSSGGAFSSGRDSSFSGGSSSSGGDFSGGGGGDSGGGGASDSY